MDKKLERFYKDMRRIAYFKKNPPEEREETQYIPSLYIKNEMWDQSKADKHIDECLTDPCQNDGKWRISCKKICRGNE